MSITESELIDRLKSLLKNQRFSSQSQLAKALSLQVNSIITQTRVSRLLKRVGAIKTRNHNNDAVYRLPATQSVPNGLQSIDSVVLDVKHNHVQIIIKTVTGAGTLIAKMIESMGEQSGILACMASDNTILVIPSNVKTIQQTMISIVEQFDL